VSLATHSRRKVRFRKSIGFLKLVCGSLSVSEASDFWTSGSGNLMTTLEVQKSRKLVRRADRLDNPRIKQQNPNLGKRGDHGTMDR
jgi:hypothetical protein